MKLGVGGVISQHTNAAKRDVPAQKRRLIFSTMDAARAPTVSRLRTNASRAALNPLRFDLSGEKARDMSDGTFHFVRTHQRGRPLGAGVFRSTGRLESW